MTYPLRDGTLRHLLAEADNAVLRREGGNDDAFVKVGPHYYPFQRTFDHADGTFVVEATSKIVFTDDQFPDGKMSADDEGQLQMAVGVKAGKVVLDFSEPCKWVGMPSAQARSLAQALLKHAEAADGQVR